MDGRQKVLEDCCTSTNKIVMVLPEIAKIVVATDAITTTLWGSQYHLQLPPCLQYLHGCYLNIKFHLYFWFCSYSCLFEAGYDIMEPAGASSSGPWGPAAKSNVADCMTYLDSKFYSPVALLSTQINVLGLNNPDINGFTWYAGTCYPKIKNFYVKENVIVDGAQSGLHPCP